ncbi:MAG: hypothetical protein R3F59_00165 [Myxococcota bacterium]
MAAALRTSPSNDAGRATANAGLAERARGGACAGVTAFGCACARARSTATPISSAARVGSRSWRKAVAGRIRSAAPCGA